MATQGRGNYPLISSWFVPRYNPPSKSLHIMRRSIGIDRDTVDNTIWSDFFFEAGSVAITGDIATTQAAQALAAVGKEDFLGTVVTGQAAQAIAAAGQEDFSATGVLSQAAQSIVVAGDNGSSTPITGDVAIDQATASLAIIGEVATVSAPAERPPRYVVGLPSEVRGRPRRQGKANTKQERQGLSTQGTVFMPIAGISLMTNGEQHIKAVGNKNTFDRDMRMIMELIDLEVA